MSLCSVYNCPRLDLKIDLNWLNKFSKQTGVIGPNFTFLMSERVNLVCNNIPLIS